MKRLVFALFIVVTVASGCSTYRPFNESRRDPVVGRTTEGRRIYEDRSGRLYTLDRNGRRVYRDDGYKADGRYKKNNKKYKAKKAKPGRRVGRGHTWDHPGKGKKKGHARSRRGRD